MRKSEKWNHECSYLNRLMSNAAKPESLHCFCMEVRLIMLSGFRRCHTVLLFLFVWNHIKYRSRFIWFYMHKRQSPLGPVMTEKCGCEWKYARSAMKIFNLVCSNSHICPQRIPIHPKTHGHIYLNGYNSNLMSMSQSLSISHAQNDAIKNLSNMKSTWKQTSDNKNPPNKKKGRKIKISIKHNGNSWTKLANKVQTTSRYDKQKEKSTIPVIVVFDHIGWKFPCMYTVHKAYVVLFDWRRLLFSFGFSCEAPMAFDDVCVWVLCVPVNKCTEAKCFSCFSSSFFHFRFGFYRPLSFMSVYNYSGLCATECYGKMTWWKQNYNNSIITGYVW